MSNGKLVSSTGLKSEINFELKELTQAEKTKAAAKWFGIFFGIAVACVFVPILHFVLVPGFLLIAVIVSMRAYKQRADLLNVQGKCPNCGKEISIQKVRIKKVTGAICPQCRDFLKIHIEE